MERSAGVLLHISSLPSKYGVGDFGIEAYNFIEFLKRSGQKLWQILPLGPTGLGDSPYQSYSAFAGSTLFIDVENLVSSYYLEEKELSILKEYSQSKIVEFKYIEAEKERLLKKCYEKFKEDEESICKFKEFELENKYWLEDYALYITIKKEISNKDWIHWPKNIKYRQKLAINKIKEEYFNTIEFQKFIQFIFYEQWFNLKKYANDQGIKIIGDIPIYVSTDSSDTWSNPEFFQLDKYMKPKRIAGCHPDNFSKTGQLWGNALYDWKKLKLTNYNWWINRIKFSLINYDVIRIDHFRAFSRYWSIKNGDKTAINGFWEKCPGKDFFNVVEKKLNNAKIIAEDLGTLDKGVYDLMDAVGYPGMKVLQFGLGEKESIYLPDVYPKNSVAYTGTHDNDTICGWYSELNVFQKENCDEYLKDYLSRKGSNFWESINWRGIEAVSSSESLYAIYPIQDVLGLGSEARMNTPGTIFNNWKWRLDKNLLTEEVENKLKNITSKFNR